GVVRYSASHLVTKATRYSVTMCCSTNTFTETPGAGSAPPIRRGGRVLLPYCCETLLPKQRRLQMLKKPVWKPIDRSLWQQNERHCTNPVSLSPRWRFQRPVRLSNHARGWRG